MGVYKAYTVIGDTADDAWLPEALRVLAARIKIIYLASTVCLPC